MLGCCLYVCAHIGWSQPGHVWWGAENTTDGGLWKQPFGHSEVPAESWSSCQPQGGSAHALLDHISQCQLVLPAWYVLMAYTASSSITQLFLTQSPAATAHFFCTTSMKIATLILLFLPPQKKHFVSVWLNILKITYTQNKRTKTSLPWQIFYP